MRGELKIIGSSDRMKLSAMIGFILLVLLVVKVAFMMGMPKFVEWWEGHDMTRFLALYVAPGEIPKWQAASATNALLGLVVFFGAREALLRMDAGVAWPEVVVRRTLGCVGNVRVLLTCYTILCTGYLTMNAARGLNWPALGTKWLPWL